MFSTNLRLCVAALLCALLVQPVNGGIGSKNVQYVGGTWTNIKEGAEGKFDVSDSKVARFVLKKEAVATIPYDQISSLEYGQKAGRRIGATIGWGVTTLGVAALPMLLSKKRKHYFTVGYKDQTGANQGVVLQLGKDITRATLTLFETRSGKQIEFESEDAKKNIGN